jgi:cytoskeletal protein RodZ
MKSVRKRLTYANVMSSIAVFLVVAGGSAFAATQLGKNTVGTKQLKNNAVTAAKIKNGAVTGAKVNVGTLPTVPSATKATDATNAANATHSKSADSAKTADTAKTATTATNALNATNAVNATNANKAATATNAESLGGAPASDYSKRLFARVSYSTATPTIIASSPGISGAGEGALGFPIISFPQSMESCAIAAIANTGAGTQILRRSTSSVGSLVQFAVKDDAGASVRADFEFIAVC